MTKTLEFPLPEGCTDIAFGRDLNRDGIKRTDCENTHYYVEERPEKWIPTQRKDYWWEGRIYAYKLKSAPVPKAEPQEGTLVKGIAELPHGMTQCGLGIVAPTDERQGCYYDVTSRSWIAGGIPKHPHPEGIYAWTTTPATVKVEVELPAPKPGKKWVPAGRGESNTYIALNYKQVDA